MRCLLPVDADGAKKAGTLYVLLNLLKEDGFSPGICSTIVFLPSIL